MYAFAAAFKPADCRPGN